MIKIEFSKLNWLITMTPQHFCVEVYWMLDGAILCPFFEYMEEEQM